MRILLAELVMLGIFNVGCYFGLWLTGDVKKYFRSVWSIIVFGNVLIGIAIPVLGFGVLAK